MVDDIPWPRRFVRHPAYDAKKSLETERTLTPEAKLEPDSHYLRERSGGEKEFRPSPSKARGD